MIIKIKMWKIFFLFECGENFRGSEEVLENNSVRIKDFLDKDYDYVSYRLTLDNWSNRYLSNTDDIYNHSTFAGCFEIKDGKIIPFDHDSYDENEEVIWYNEWRQADVKHGLTLLVKTDWIRG